MQTRLDPYFPLWSLSVPPTRRGALGSTVQGTHAGTANRSLQQQLMLNAFKLQTAVRGLPPPKAYLLKRHSSVSERWALMPAASPPLPLSAAHLKPTASQPHRAVRQPVDLGALSSLPHVPGTDGRLPPVHTQGCGLKQEMGLSSFSSHCCRPGKLQQSWSASQFTRTPTGTPTGRWVL